MTVMSVLWVRESLQIFTFFLLALTGNQEVTVSVCPSACLSVCDIIEFFVVSSKTYFFETKIEYILPVWNMYLGGFDPESFSFRGSSCLTLNQLGYISLFSKLLQITTKIAFLALK